MRDNINKVSERGARLDSLQDKTDNLAVSAQGFRRGANRVRKQMWWKDMKMRMCLIVGIIILLIVIIVPSGEFVEQLVLLFVLLTWTSRCHAKELNHPHEIPRIIHINNCADGGGCQAIGEGDEWLRAAPRSTTWVTVGCVLSIPVFFCIPTVVLQSRKAPLHGTLRPCYDIPREPKFQAWSSDEQTELYTVGCCL